MGRRLGLVAVALLLALAAVAAAGVHKEFVTVKESSCWRCHSNWNPPLKAIAVPIPPLNVTMPVNEPIEYTVQIQNTWRADLTLLKPTLDIAMAPSLRFVDKHQPIHNTTGLTVSVDNQRLTQPQNTTHKFYLADGASRFSASIEPQDKSPATGPKAKLLLRAPNGQHFDVEAADYGQRANRTFTRADLDAVGSGTWVVGVEITPATVPSGLPDPTNPHLPQTGDVPFTLVEDAAFDSTGTVVSTYTSKEMVPRGTSTLFTWDLQLIAQPAEGEYVTVFANNTGYYKHVTTPDTGNDDNVTYAAKAYLEQVNGHTELVNKDAVSIRPAVLNGATLASISEAIGYASAILLISSIVSGGMFGRASRRSLNSVFHSAKRRVAFHNFLSYGLTVAALGHTVIFLVEEQYQILIGALWGGIAILSMFLLGVTGALQVPMIRRWNYATWRWTHYGLTVAAIVFTLVHLLLDGTNFGHLREAWHLPEPIGSE